MTDTRPLLWCSPSAATTARDLIFTVLLTISGDVENSPSPVWYSLLPGMPACLLVRLSVWPWGRSLQWPWESLNSPVQGSEKNHGRYSIMKSKIKNITVKLPGYVNQHDTILKNIQTANRLWLNLDSYQLTKQMSSHWKKKLCFVCFWVECKLSKLPFTTMSWKTTEIIRTATP